MKIPKPSYEPHHKGSPLIHLQHHRTLMHANKIVKVKVNFSPSHHILSRNITMKIESRASKEIRDSDVADSS
jgi:hypothetical protein